jgi:tetratricopeptide (TPR) repeat protein
VNLAPGTSPIIDFSDYISRHSHDFSPRDWIFNTLDQWIAKPDERRFFIITGAPGSGKTAIAARLAQFSRGAAEPPDQLMGVRKGFLSAIHFCSFRDRRWLSPHVFSRSIALQLAQRYPAYANALAEKSGERAIHINVDIKVGTANEVAGVVIQNIELGKISSDDAFIHLVREPLEKLISGGHDGRIVILIDALDDALSYGSDLGIASLITNGQEMPAQVRFVLTCRPEPSLLLPLRRASSVEYTLSSGEGLAKSEEDVRRYVNDNVRSSPNLSRKLSAKLSITNFLEIVSAKSGGNFLYIKYLLDMLAFQGEEIDLHSLQKLPEGLDGIYREFLERLVAGRVEAWLTQYGPVLGTLSVAHEALSEDQLAHFIGVKIPILRQLLISLRPFIEVNEALPASARRYTIYHRSFAEFLLDRDKAENYWCSPNEQHAAIARYYLEYCGSNGNVDCKRMDSYALKNLAEHLRSAAEYNALFRLTRNQRFREEQARRLIEDPGAPLRTLQTALMGALEADRAGEMAEFMLTYARGLLGLTQESPLEALRGGNLDRAWALVPLYPIERRTLWYLLLAWELHDNGRASESQKTLERALQKCPRLIGWEGVYAASLLPYVFEVSEDSFQRLEQQLLDDNQRPSLCASLVHHGYNYVANKIAQRIGEPESRRLAFESIAVAQTKTNKVLRAVATARKIDDGRARAKTLAVIAASQIRSGEESEGISTLKEAIESAGDSADALARIMGVLGQIGGMPGGNALAQTTMSTRFGSQGVAAFAAEAVRAGKIGPSDGEGLLAKASQLFMDYGENSKDQAAKSPSETPSSDETGIEARLSPETEKLITEVRDKAEGADADRAALAAIADAFSSIAEVQLRTGLQDSAQKNFESAAEIANSISWLPYRVDVLTSLATNRRKAGDENGADEIFARAIEAARESKFGGERVAALARVAMAQAASGKMNEAHATLTEAVQFTKELNWDHERYEAFAAIASVENQWGNLLSARSYYSRALLSPPPIETRSRPTALARIAKVQALDQDQDKDTAQAIFDTALQLAREIPDKDKDEREFALESIATAQGEAGLVNQALETAESISDEGKRARSLVTVGWAQAQAGDQERGKATLTRALQMAANDDKALSLVAVGLYSIGEREVARETLAKAVENTLERLSQGGVVLDLFGLEPIAMRQAQVREFNDAVETARRMKDDWVKWKTLGAIAAEQARAGEVSEALVTARMIEVEGVPSGVMADQVLQRGEGYVKGSAAIIRAKAFAEIAAAHASEKQRVATATKSYETLDTSTIIDDALQMIDDAQSVAAGQIGGQDLAEAFAAIAAAQTLTGEKEKAWIYFSKSFDMAQDVIDENARESALASIATAQARVGLSEQAVLTGKAIVKTPHVYTSQIAEALADSNDPKSVKFLLPSSSADLHQSHSMCAILARAFPDQARAIAKELTY